MSWLSDLVGVNIDVNHAVDNAIAPVKAKWDDFFSSSVGQPLKKNFDAQTNAAQNVGAFAGNVATGKWQAAGENLGKIGGGIGHASAGPAGMIFGTKEGQAALKNPYVDKATFGYTSDYAGLISGYDSLTATGRMKDSERDASLRFGVKSAVIGGGAYLAQEGMVPTYLQNPGTMYVGAQALQKGDVAGAVNAVGGSDYLPSRPDWLPDINLNPNQPRPSSQPSYMPQISGVGSSAPQVTNPWQFGGRADSGISSSQVSNSLYLIAAVAVGLFVLRKKGVI